MPTCVQRRELQHAAHRARVIEARAHVAVAQVGVGVDLQHRQVPGGARPARSTTGDVIECSPPSTNGNLSALRSAPRDPADLGQQRPPCRRTAAPSPAA